MRENISIHGKIKAPTSAETLSEHGRFIQRLRRNEPTWVILPRHFHLSILNESRKKDMTVMRLVRFAWLAAVTLIGSGDACVQSALNVKWKFNDLVINGAKRQDYARNVASVLQKQIVNDASLVEKENFGDVKNGKDDTLVLPNARVAGKTNERQKDESAHRAYFLVYMIRKLLKKRYSIITVCSVYVVGKPIPTF